MFKKIEVWILYLTILLAIIFAFFLVYWLEQWHLFYKNQIFKFSTNTFVIFISYERFIQE